MFTKNSSSFSFLPEMAITLNVESEIFAPPDLARGVS